MMSSLFSQCSVVDGKPVPKALQKYHNIGDGGDSSWLGSDLYHTAQVLKGTPLEVRHLWRLHFASYLGFKYF